MYEDIMGAIHTAEPEQSLKKVKIMHRAVMICLQQVDRVV